MFFASNLGSGTHTLTMRPGGSGLGELAIDYVNVYTAASLGGRFVCFPLSFQTSLIVRGDSFLQDLSSSASCGTSSLSTVPAGVLGALAGLAVVAVAGVLASVYLFWRLRRITRNSKLDEGSRPWIEEPRPFRARAPTPIATTVATDNISYPRSDISTPAVSPSAYERSMSGHTRGNYSVTSTAITGQNTQVNPPDYEEGMLQGRGGGYSQSRRDNLPIKLRNQ